MEPRETRNTRKRYAACVLLRVSTAKTQRGLWPRPKGVVHETHGKHEAALPQPEGVNHERHQPHEKGALANCPHCAMGVSQSFESQNLGYADDANWSFDYSRFSCDSRAKSTNFAYIFRVSTAEGQDRAVVEVREIPGPRNTVSSCSIPIFHAAHRHLSTKGARPSQPRAAPQVNERRSPGHVRATDVRTKRSQSYS